MAVSDDPQVRLMAAEEGADQPIRDGDPQERAFLDEYDFRDYPAAAVTVDIVVFTIEDDVLHVVLVQRGERPYRGRWALPGGFVRLHEDLAQAARRELEEETRIQLVPDHLEQLRAYGDPERDPRRGPPDAPGRIVTIAFWTVMAETPKVIGGGDAADARLEPVANVVGDEGIRLAFDHKTIVEDALQRASARLEYTTEATRYCPPEFTISQLRGVYEAVWDTKLDHGNFQRKVRSEPAFLVDLGRRVPSGEAGGRPAALFSAPEPGLLQQPLTAGNTASSRWSESFRRARSSDTGYPAWLAGPVSKPPPAAERDEPDGD